MTSFLYRLGQRCARHPFRVLAAWLVVAVAATMANGSVGGPTSDEFTIPGSESQAAFDLLEERFPEETGAGSRIVFHTEDGTLTDPAFQAAVDASLVELASAPHVIEVTNPYDPRGPTLSPDGAIGFADVSYDTDDLEMADFEAAEAAVATARAAGVNVDYSGGLVWAGAEQETGSEMIGIGIAIIVLLVAFGSVIAMGIPVGTAIFGVLIGMSLLGVLAGQTDVPEVSPMIATMIGLGVGLDYPLFVVTRHRELLHEGFTVHDAAAKANATAGQAVLFAGVTVVIAICGLQVSGIPAVATMGYSAAIVVAVAMLLAVSLLPALLGLVGTKIDKLRLPRLRRRSTATAGRRPAGAASGRWANHVAERPWRYTLGSLAILVVLAAPVTQLRVAFPDDSNAATSSTERRSYDLLSEGFGAGFNSSVVIAVDLTGSERDEAVLASIHDALEADRGIVSVDPPAVNAGGDTAVVSATPSSAPQDADTDRTVDRLRAVIPAAVAGSGAEAYVTGDAAAMADVSAKLTTRLPYFIGAVVLMSFVLLVLVFRSILVPAKAALMNLLSIGASYGVIVAVLQWGWGSSLLGVHDSIPVSPFVPMIMFAILFGLSMDYEVFLLSRIREQFLRHGDSKRSVVEGLTSTARVITSSALIMISVFGAFMLSPDLTLKTFGLGLTTAIIIDATLVRMVLVPATMSLLGSANWWLPKWLDKRLPRFDFEGHDQETPGAPESIDPPEVIEPERELVERLILPQALVATDRVPSWGPARARLRLGSSARRGHAGPRRSGPSRWRRRARTRPSHPRPTAPRRQGLTAQPVELGLIPVLVGGLDVEQTVGDHREGVLLVAGHEIDVGPQPEPEVAEHLHPGAVHERGHLVHLRRAGLSITEGSDRPPVGRPHHRDEHAVARGDGLGDAGLAALPGRARRAGSASP